MRLTFFSFVQQEAKAGFMKSSFPLLLVPPSLCPFLLPFFLPFIQYCSKGSYESRLRAGGRENKYLGHSPVDMPPGSLGGNGPETPPQTRPLGLPSDGSGQGVGSEGVSAPGNLGRGPKQCIFLISYQQGIERSSGDTTLERKAHGGLPRRLPTLSLQAPPLTRPPVSCCHPARSPPP